MQSNAWIEIKFIGETSCKIQRQIYRHKKRHETKKHKKTLWSDII